MDTITKIAGYGIAKILFSLIIAVGAGMWVFLKKQKNELPKKYEKFKEDKIKNDYRKQLEKEVLVERLKQEVRNEIEASSNKKVE